MAGGADWWLLTGGFRMVFALQQRCVAQWRHQSSTELAEQQVWEQISSPMSGGCSPVLRHSQLLRVSVAVADVSVVVAVTSAAMAGSLTGSVVVAVSLAVVSDSSSVSGRG